MKRNDFKKLPSPNVYSQYMRLFKNKFGVKKYNKRYLYSVQDLILLWEHVLRYCLSAILLWEQVLSDSSSGPF